MRVGSTPPKSRPASFLASGLGKQRIATLVDLISRVSAWRLDAQKARRTIAWKFRVHDARHVFRYGGLATARSEH
jgi:hypothetical protein